MATSHLTHFHSIFKCIFSPLFMSLVLTLYSLNSFEMCFSCDKLTILFFEQVEKTHYWMLIINYYWFHQFSIKIYTQSVNDRRFKLCGGWKFSLPAYQHVHQYQIQYLEIEKLVFNFCVCVLFYCFHFSNCQNCQVKNLLWLSIILNQIFSVNILKLNQNRTSNILQNIVK